tara:strand:- start:646 stop:1455 length:810 start_codon:yes stop_codon:yes gene_type:complete
VGLLYVMFFAMWSDVTQWLILALFGTIGFGVAFTVLTPGEVTGDDRPFLRPFWVLVGDFDRFAVGDYSAESGVEWEGGVLSSTLLFVYVFMMTVVLVNMLIAQMSSTYERLKHEQRGLWLAGRVVMLYEYLDLTPAPAPFNLISEPILFCTSCWRHLLQMLFPKSKSVSPPTPKKEGRGEERGPIPRSMPRLILPMRPMAARQMYRLACEACKTYLAVEHRAEECSLDNRVVQVITAQQEMSTQLEAVINSVKAINAKLETLTGMNLQC